MFITHKLKKTEDFKVVMRKYKVTDWKSTWNLPQNKRLRAKRKYADQVQAGDTLVILDPKAKLRTVKFLGTTYNIPDAEWDATKRDIVRVIEKKFFPKLLALKKTYDDDYNYMWSIANEDGWLVGMLAAAVENLSFADVPTKEMSKVSKSVGNVQKALKKGDCLQVVVAMSVAQAAMKEYVEASEKYRRRVTNGATKGVEFLEFTRDNAFILLGALATGGVGAAAPAAAFSALEIGAAVGAATALTKSASNEVGNYMANNSRSGEEITIAIIRDTYLGAAQGALGGVVFSKLSAPVTKGLAKGVKSKAPQLVGEYVKKNKVPSFWNKVVCNKYGVAVTTEIIEEAVGKFSVAKTIGIIGKWCKTKEGADMLGDAAKDVFKSLSGKEKDGVIGSKVAASLIASGATRKIVELVLQENKALIDKALKAKAEEGEKEAA